MHFLMKSGLKLKKYIFLFIVVLFGSIFLYRNTGDRSEEERLAAAEYTFKDFVFETRVDAENFKGPVTENQENGMKRYRWEGNFPGNRIVGVDVYISSKKSIEPIAVGTGEDGNWSAIAGSKSR